MARAFLEQGVWTWVRPPPTAVSVSPVSVTSVPAPSSAALLALGLLGLVASGRRRG
jgi:MYXO-CTERM domain-containing protein